MKKCYLAFDLGASSGRLMAACTEGDQITLKELHRFANAPVNMGGFLYWDLPYLYREIKDGLKKAAAYLEEEKIQAQCIGIDTWGVDYGYLAKDGSILGSPFCYRDSKNARAMAECPMDFAESYKIAGLQQMDFNTVYQLWHDVKHRPEVVENADCLLFLPDLLNYFLTGVKGCEYTIASTSALLAAKTRDWSDEILEKIGFPRRLLLPITDAGNKLGCLTKEVQDETGLPAIPVALVGSHDTASALAGIPFTGEDQAFLSSGTWSLIGLEIDEPVITDESCEANFTNEGAVDGKIKFLKNISGLWIIQQLRKQWQSDFPTMIKMARENLETELIIDPDDAAFLAPISMEGAIRDYLKEHGQREPLNRGEVVACVYRGLTEKYRLAVENLKKLTGKDIRAIHMVGGGIQDELLCELTMKKTGLDVITGPIEAAALGNALMQMKAVGDLSSLKEGREMIGRSFPIKKYTDK